MNNTSTYDKLQTAIKNYDKIGWGGELPKEDREVVHDYVIRVLSEQTGMTTGEAIKLVHILEGGSWSDGWDKGYSSAKNHYSVSVRPSFSLGIQS
jgi:hypothetical protein